MRIHRIKVSTGEEATIYLCDDENLAAITAKAEKAMKAGATVTWQDGRQQWINDDILFDSSKNGSAAFQWDRSGNRVKHERFLVTRTPDGQIRTEAVGTVFKRF